MAAARPTAGGTVPSGDHSGGITLYVWLLADIDTARVRSACRAVLSTEERQRLTRFKFERDKREFLFAHGLLRFGLSCRMPSVDPADWRFAIDFAGRPGVCGPITRGAVHFSLSHTRGCVTCVVSPHRAIGVDVEWAGYCGRWPEVARATFTRTELQALDECPPPDRRRLFYDIWTAKEAVAKAIGMGLRTPFTDFGVSEAERDEMAISFMPGLDGDPAHWRFKRVRPSLRHTLAVADGSGCGLAVDRPACPLFTRRLRLS